MGEPTNNTPPGIDPIEQARLKGVHSAAVQVRVRELLAAAAEMQRITQVDPVKATLVTYAHRIAELELAHESLLASVDKMSIGFEALAKRAVQDDDAIDSLTKSVKNLTSCVEMLDDRT